jgi:hypothetical protein
MIMKRILLLTFAMSIALFGFSQQRAIAPKELRNQAVKMVKPTAETMNFSNETLPSSKALFPPEEEVIGNTRFDLQSNASSPCSRIVAYDDGTIGAVFSFGLGDAAFTDRGTAYNYYDGSAWGPIPTERIEGGVGNESRTGWPSYSAWGENGEINVAHYSGTGSPGGLAFAKRASKGTGTWELSELHSPELAAEYLWPRMTTSGVDHSVIHTIALTMPVANGGIVYQGLDGALLYSRSNDGGANWDPQNLLIEGVSSSYYLSNSADAYEIAAQGDNVAILYGDGWQDLGLLKSTDGGETWTKTLIWECPYPFWATGQITDTFYCADGAHDLAFDQSGTVHVVFGINRALSADGAAQSWFPLVDGLGYWNENRPVFSNDMNSLCPYSDCSYTELEDDYSLIGWSQDINNNGTWDILGLAGGYALYYIGPSSMPQILVDDNNEIYIVFASITETFNNGIQDYRHLWARYSPNGEFWSPFVDLTSDLIHIFDECVFPTIAEGSDDYFHLVYQTDIEPGLAVRGDLDPYGDNSIRYMKVLKDDIKVGITENNAINDYDVLQNYPNPASDLTTVNVNIRKTSDLSLEVVNMMGQTVLTVDAGVAQPGMNTITFDVSNLSNGAYFYTVKAGDASVSKKMIIE